MNTQKMTPELRFPEFSGEWQVKKLGNVVYFRNGKAHEKSVVDNGDYVIVNSKFISTNGRIRKFSNSQIEPLQKNEIVMVMSDIPNGKALAKCYYIDSSGIYSLNQRICALTEKKPNCNKMLFYSINRNKYFLSFDNGVSQTNLRKDEVLNCPLYIPSGDEQEKIAEFLTTVDARIAAGEQKLASLTQYKKAVMQQIFSQQIRFKDEDSNPYPDWQEKRLGELGSFKSGVGFSNSQQGGQNGIPFYKVSDMNLPENSTTMTTANNYVTDEQIQLNRYKPITEQAIIFAKVGAAIFLERKRIADNFLIDNNMMAFTPNKSLSFEFAKIIFDKTRLSALAQVGALPSYNGSDLSIIKVALPELEEQQKIATFLTTLDARITAETTGLDSAKQWKKGLLQRMFV